MDEPVAIVIGTVIAGVVASLSSIVVALMNDRSAAKREERLYARQDKVATDLLASNERSRLAAESAAGHALAAAAEIKIVADKVEEVHLATNSLAEIAAAARVALAANLADAAGEKRGIEMGRAEAKKP